MQANSPKERKLFIKTWGCQMNEHDSEVVAGLLREEGYQLVDNEDEADFLYLNTCSVREKAENKLYSQLGRWKHFKQTNPDLRIAVAGCVAQQNRSAIQERAPHVDLVIGTHQFRHIRDFVRNNIQGVATDWARDDVDARFDEPLWKIAPGSASAMITIMEGCDQMCTFCIVPFTRGREISRPTTQILERVRRYADQGISEIMLLGQNVNAYGKGQATFPAFPELLAQVCAVPGIRRVRFTSPHPQDFSEELADAYGQLPNLARHAHIPLQAGDDKVLERMNRPYTAEGFRQTVARLRAACPDISISTDIIVGFPGETRAQFEQTLALIREIRFSQVYSFVYSARPNTRAATWKDPVPTEEKKAWLQELQATQQAIQCEVNADMTGTEHEVLAYRHDPGTGYLAGRTDGNTIVHFAGSPEGIGQYHHVHIMQGFANSLRGELVAG